MEDVSVLIILSLNVHTHQHQGCTWGDLPSRVEEEEIPGEVVDMAVAMVEVIAMVPVENHIQDQGLGRDQDHQLIIEIDTKDECSKLLTTI
jgi:hypothetical protein